ncbi:MAG TPA: hypothetical protein VII28_08340 [Puia sp.]
MKKIVLPVFIFTVLILSCKSKHKSLADRVKANFLSHVKKIDSTLVLDSFSIIKIDTINRKTERIIDDTLYMMEFNRVRTQLANAKKGSRADSIEFYQGEVNYMQTQFDSLKREIAAADTTKRLGMLAICRVRLSRDTTSREMTVFYFLDWSMKVWNPEMIDTAISGLSKKLH